MRYKILTISIPTRNKILLENNLKHILDCTLKNKIKVLICDNCESDEIEELYNKIRLQYSNVDYVKNKKEKNFDINCLNALKLPETTYIWVIGDGLIPDSSKIQKILKILEKDYDFIIFDFMGRLRREDIKNNYENEVEFFKDICWHATLLGSTIVKKKLIEETLKLNSSKYIGSFFIHLGVLLEAISNENFKGLIEKGEVCKRNNLKNGSTWSHFTFGTFCEGWIKFINLLPETYNSEKEHVIKYHGIKSKLFSIKGFILIRLVSKEYSLKDIYRNRKNIKRITNVPLILIYIIWLFPKFILTGAEKVLKKVKKGKING